MSKRTHSKVPRLRESGPNATDIPSLTARGWDAKPTKPTCRKTKKNIQEERSRTERNGLLIKISWKNHQKLATAVIAEDIRSHSSPVTLPRLPVTKLSGTATLSPVKIIWKNHKDSEGKFKCPVCSRAHANPNTAQQHYVTHFKPRFSCDDCEGQFHLSTQFRAHFLWKCKICQKAFKNGKIGLTNHIRKKHPDQVMKYHITHRGYEELPTTTEGIGKMEALVVPRPQKEIVQIRIKKRKKIRRRQLLLENEQLKTDLACAQKKIAEQALIIEMHEKMISAIKDVVVQI